VPLVFPPFPNARGLYQNRCPPSPIATRNQPSDVKVRFGSGSGPFALNAEPEPGVAFGQLPNLELERVFTFGSAFEHVRTEIF
jgi:hypothetical protein